MAMDFGSRLLVKYLFQSLSHTEQEKLDAWRSISPENQQLFSEVAKMRLLKEFEQLNSPAQIAVALAHTKSKIRRRALRHRFLRVSQYAAAFMLVVVLSFIIWERFISEKQTTITVAENESVKKIDLPDGSMVWLSAASELRIPESFPKRRRKIALKGKAYFEIEKNEESPFVIHTPYINIKVIGTSFSLSVNDETRQVETILASGSVALQDDQGKNIFEMSPGEKVVYTAKDHHYTVSTVDVNTLTAWHLEQITFEDATLREIVNKLGLIYSVNINLESKKLADRRYRYVINKEETLEEALDILCFLAPIQYRIEANEVFITEFP